MAGNKQSGINTRFKKGQIPWNLGHTKPIQERLERDSVPIPECGCWIWYKSIDKDGYGQLHFKKDGNRVRTLAHRVSWEFHCGPIPNGISVLHKCDTPSCINPDHLFLGTQKENVVDSIKKGRHSFGSKKPNAKLTENDVIDIRKDSRMQTEIAKAYNVSTGLICHIKNRTAWKHVVTS